MKSPLRILYLEDNRRDVDLVAALLEREGVEHVLIDVDSRKAFAENLAAAPPDVIFSDYTLPSYNGLHALEDAGLIAPELPFIFVSGTIGEENAIETLKRGATDYVLKQNLRRLVPVLRRALAEKDELRRRREAEELIRQKEQRFSAFMSNLPGVAFIKDKDRRYVFVNEAAQSYICHDPIDCLGRRDEEILPGDLAERMRRSDEEVLGEKHVVHVIEDIALGDGHHRWFTTKFPITDKYGTANWLGGVGIDVSTQPGLVAVSTNA
ncbi:MAG: PAS domain-containing protein [Bacteroidetes bacterium]|nr:PAS domain-containing protein [Bacteroidota bacterium]